MGKWSFCGLLGVMGVGVLAFLRIVSNEVETIEKSLELLVEEERERVEEQERWQNSAA
jgi:hypothetical protein